MSSDKKIDLVYLWVDGEDENWLKKKAYYQSEKCEKEAVQKCRFVSNDELKYSLRSVEKNASWINKIYIVTDGQVPSWLNLENDKVRIIDHSEIVPQDKLPLFNSNAIELRLPFIPDLSEYFLYANDDMFFWSRVEKDFFFEGDKPICRLFSEMKLCDEPERGYDKTVHLAYREVFNKFGKPKKTGSPHHCIDAYKKSVFIDCLNAFPKLVSKTLNNRFRTHEDWQRMIVIYYALATEQGVEKWVKPTWLDKNVFRKVLDTKCFNLSKRTVKRIEQLRAKLVCLNDCEKTTDKDRLKVQEIMEKHFPEKSSFEK